MMITVLSCKSKEQKDAQNYMDQVEKTMKENPVKTDEQKTSSGSFTIPSEMADIVGEWELVGFTGDTNDNLQIDEEERKNLKTPAYKDYMKLDSDGSGLFTIGKMEGRYEIKKESNGRSVMKWYDKGNGEHRIGSVMKVSKEELTIKEPGGNGLFLWKRL
jgi:hypothetical protein